MIRYNESSAGEQLKKAFRGDEQPKWTSQDFEKTAKFLQKNKHAFNDFVEEVLYGNYPSQTSLYDYAKVILK